MTFDFHHGVLLLQRIIAGIGVLIIISGVLWAAFQYAQYLLQGCVSQRAARINVIRLNFGRVIILGLEFIVAADLISTISTPDYYDLGLVAIVVLIRTLLSYSLSKEISDIATSEQS